MSLISHFFQKPELVDFSVLKTDIHSHYLPGIDDGCKTEEESVGLLKRMNKCGFQKIYCTPHIQAEYYCNTRETIFPVFEKLQESVSSIIPGLELQVAAEYLIDDGFEKHIKEGLISFGEKKYVLVEVSYYNPHPMFKNLLQDVMMKGYTPILAHPERYIYWSVNDKILEDLQTAGVLFQVNLPSLCGYYGPEVRKRAFDLLAKGFISVAGSDVHNDRYADSVIDGIENRKLQDVLISGVLKNAELF